MHGCDRIPEKNTIAGFSTDDRRDRSSLGKL
jgi:hypothetical protein